MLRNKKGITLIALVVTIVVLLILAGISISLIVDKNGIIQKSKDARRVTKEAAKNELDNMNRLIEDMNDAAPEWRGTTTELPEFKNNETTNKFDWYIYNEPQMKFFANFVNKTLTAQDEKLMSDKNVTAEDIAITEETTIYLMNDLDLGARFDENGKLTLGVEWVPVGKNTANKLLGTFEGNNHYIKGVYVNSDTKFCGIFGNTNTIKNLTVKNSYIEGNNCTGGIAGAVRGGKVENCHNMNTTVVLKEGNMSVAGIVGQSSVSIENCTNTGTIYAYGRYTNDYTHAGGIVGIFIGSSISNCINKGNVISGEEAGLYVGGICGSTGADYVVTISDCKNEGKVSGVAVTGGIIGLLSTKGIVERCSNVGDIFAIQQSAAGIAGQMNQKNGQSNSIVRLCYNSGNISGGPELGGIVAFFCGQSQQGTVENCYSKGTITTTDNDKGAIIGKKIQADGNATFNNLYYLNTIGLYAINNNQSYESDTVKAVENDIKTYEEFLEWIKTK